MNPYPVDKRLKSFSIESLYREIYNREANEDLYQKEKNHKDEIHETDFPEGTEYIIFEYDVITLNRKQYQVNKSLALRALTIAELHGIIGKVRRGTRNQVLVFGESKRFLRMADFVKVIFLSLECLGDPKLDWNAQCEKYFSRNTKEARIQ